MTENCHIFNIAPRSRQPNSFIPFMVTSVTDFMFFCTFFSLNGSQLVILKFLWRCWSNSIWKRHHRLQLVCYILKVNNIPLKIAPPPSPTPLRLPSTPPTPLPVNKRPEEEEERKKRRRRRRRPQLANSHSTSSRFWSSSYNKLSFFLHWPLRWSLLLLLLLLLLLFLLHLFSSSSSLLLSLLLCFCS